MVYCDRVYFLCAERFETGSGFHPPAARGVQMRVECPPPPPGVFSDLIKCHGNSRKCKAIFARWNVTWLPRGSYGVYVALTNAVVTPFKAASYEPRIAILGIWGDTWLTRGKYGIYVAVRGSYGVYVTPSAT